MNQLTQEHFDQIVKGLAQTIGGLATKQDVQASENRLIERIDESQSDLARITSAGFASMEERFNDLDVKAQMKAFERKFQKLEEALHIKL